MMEVSALQVTTMALFLSSLSSSSSSYSHSLLWFKNCHTLNKLFIPRTKQMQLFTIFVHKLNIKIGSTHTVLVVVLVV